MKEKLESLSVSELLYRAYQLEPEKEVLFDGYSRMTYGELMDQSCLLAASLQKMGISKGDRIAVCLPNWNEFVVIYFAAAHIGAVIVPFNTRYRMYEVQYNIRNSGAKLAFFTNEFDGVNHMEQFLEAKENVTSLKQLITVRYKADQLESYEQIIKGEEVCTSFNRTAVNPKKDVFTILFTSGSTGSPKGAMLTHANVVMTAIKTAEQMDCTAEDVFFVSVPVFHVFGMVPSILSAVSVGARMVLLDEYKPEKALSLTESEKITVKHGVPTMFILELNHKNFHQYDLSSLRTGIIAAAPCPVEIVKRIRQEMGCEIMVAYGLSETSPTLTMTSFSDSDVVRAETVGKALPGAEVKIVDNNRNEVMNGEVGEIACRSFGVMKGYCNMPEHTKAVLDEDGWFYTGDLGTIDIEGNLRIVGRKKEMVVRGGYNIYPREIEEVFYQHPDVMEAAVVGLPDTVLGEISCACITLKPHSQMDEKDLFQFIRERIADYKVPDKMIILDEFPMTASGKIKKISLREELIENLEGELR
ncbi:AMP-binding protein [Siminovitchia sp. FSL H7-0308]|uniref:Fatty-acyl-CoA synthase n=1 Tax=Siminovitchia thermophila TaxID=1245522 RepID=A0ABS2RBJ7_9BACI|nr:AMP-binding protein [Siminovitchia thermophila]MBM7717033.1 fatty-acyl-CoA synthase [Siminovitchia thermophila]ONK24589.1 long-chain acyl-CoA synthetase [Bacillus sp. VT-16-64]